MAEMVKDFFWGMPIALYIILFLSIGLGVAGFCVPPLGVISGSVLKAMGLVLGATWLFYVTANIPTFIERGAKIKASYGDATLEIGRHKIIKEEKENNDSQELIDSD